MKRFATLALVATLVMGLASVAGAVELKTRGEFQAHADWIMNGTEYTTGQITRGTATDGTTINTGAGAGIFKSNKNLEAHRDSFQVQQRLRTWFDFVANENLRAVWGLEVGTNIWGNNGTTNINGITRGTANTGRSGGFGLDGDGVNVETKHAFLDFNIPTTKVNLKAGLLPITFPNAFGSSAVHDADSAALVVTSPITDMIGVTAGWTRGIDGNPSFDGTTRSFDEADVMLLAVPITPEGMTIVPWFSYASVGKDLGENLLDNGSMFGQWAGSPVAPTSSNSLGLVAPVSVPNLGGISDTTTAWWVGLAYNLKLFDPFEFGFDFNYGKENNGGAEIKRSGWMLDFIAKYKGWSFAEPRLFFMYSTGENDDSSTTLTGNQINRTNFNNIGGGNMKSERMPFLLEDWYFPGGMWHGGSAFDSQNGHNADFGGLSNSIGTWTLGAGLYGMSFLQDLKHDLILAYIQGTNNKNSVPMLLQQGYNVGTALTSKDSIFEIDFNHEYKIYEQLSAILELGCLIGSYGDNWNNVNYISGVNLTNGTATIGRTPDDWNKTDTAWRALLGFKYKF